MKFAAVAGHRCGRATPSLHDAPQRQSMERIGRESIYRDRNAVQTNPATSDNAPSRTLLSVEVAGHKLQADVATRSLRRVVAAISELGPDGMALVLQGSCC